MHEQIIALLKEHQNQPVSGEALSRMLGVSRTAIQKNVQKIIESGYEIEAKSRVGYCLKSSPDRMYPWEIKPYLNTRRIGQNILYLPGVDSTNRYAKAYAADGFENGTVVVAESQTKGRGRRGRSWQDIPGRNLCMSVLLKPLLTSWQIAPVTLLAAQAVCSALRESYSLDAKIKWPNDIVVDRRKICGILTEAAAQESMLEHLVIGIGINCNVSQEEFAPDHRGIATSMGICTGEAVDRRQLAADVLFRLEQLYEIFVQNDSIAFFLEEYKRNCVNLGRELLYEGACGCVRGVGHDVDKDGRLIIRMPDGHLEQIAYGEVSVRGIY